MLCAHELGHLILHGGDTRFRGTNEKYELEANLFAVAFLFSEEKIGELEKEFNIRLVEMSDYTLQYILKIFYISQPDHKISQPDHKILQPVLNKCIVDPLGNPISDIKNICIDVSEINDWMLYELNKNPTDLYQLSSRRFEELIAEIFMRKGYNVELTQATRDGGKDIYVASKNDLGSFLYLVECKKNNPSRKVGVSVIRDLYGVLCKEKATYGIVATTSYFSKPAHDFQRDIQFQMDLKNFDSIKQWISDVI